jgi:hypothetical protein
MHANTQRAADARRGPNIATAKALSDKLRTTDEPLTTEERRALAILLLTLIDRVDPQPCGAFDQRLAWATVSSSFDTRMTILRGEHREEDGAL